MSSNTEEISSIIKEQIKAYRSRTEMTETGTVIRVGDGIARWVRYAGDWALYDGYVTESPSSLVRT